MELVDVVEFLLYYSLSVVLAAPNYMHVRFVICLSVLLLDLFLAHPSVISYEPVWLDYLIVV